MEPKKKDPIIYIMAALTVVFALYLSLLLSMSYESVKDDPIITTHQDADGNFVEKQDFDILAMLQDFSIRLSTSPDEIEWNESSLKFLGGCGFICFLIIGYFASNQKKYISGKEYGTSEWGNPKDLAHLWAENIKKSEKSKEANQKYSEGSNIILTQTEKICMYNFELNNNTMIIGGSGSGKTRGYVLPNILQCCNNPFSPSLVITDPKGEIIGKIGNYLIRADYVIKVLNLKEQDRSFGFNPFKYILAYKYEEQISSLVDGVMNSKGDGNEQKANDPFWDDMAKVLLKAIFYAVYEGFPQEEQNIPVVMKLFRWFEVSDDDDRYSTPTKLDRFFMSFGDKDGTYQVGLAIESFFNKYYREFMKQTGVKISLPFHLMDIREKIAIPVYSTDCEGISAYRTEIERLTTLVHDMAEPDENGELVGLQEFDTLSQQVMAAIEGYIKDRADNYKNGKKPIGVSIFEEYGDINSNPALRSWEDFRTKCKGKTAQSVTATALAKIAPFDEVQIRRIFSKDEMDLDLIGERKTALFIVLPPTIKTYNFIANMLYRTLFEQLEYCATVTHKEQQRLPVPVRFILDEFYNTGKIPNFDNILSYARSFGIGISIILQSLDQIKEMYEKSWGTLLDNCSTFLYLGGIRHNDTLKYISDLLGDGTFDKRTISETKSFRENSSTIANDKIGRKLLDPSEVQRLNKKKCLLFVQGYQPFQSQKFNYKKHPHYQFTSDADKKNFYHYMLPSEMEEEKLKEQLLQQIENQEVTHGEEFEKKEKPESKEPAVEKTAPITLNTQFDQNVKKLEKNVIFYNFVNTEEVKLSEDEESEMDLILKMMEEEEEANKNVAAVLQAAIKPTPPIEVIIDTETIENLTQSFVDKKEEVAIVNVEEEVTEADLEADEIWEADDTDLSLDQIQNSLNDIVNGMVEDDFLKELHDVDMNTLAVGEQNVETAI